jgi:hypothetical protein
MTAAVKNSVRLFAEFTVECVRFQAVACELSDAVRTLPLDDLDTTEMRRRYVRLRPMMMRLGEQLTEIADTIDLEKPM